MRYPAFCSLSRTLAIAFLAFAFTATVTAATEKILHNFIPQPDGVNPSSALIADAAGNLYGVTPQGGRHGDGVVYELTRGNQGQWSQKVLRDFGGVPDGRQPQGRLVMDAAGNLYGTTEYGGDPNCYVFGCGIAYELTPTAHGPWKETTLHTFYSYYPDAQYPLAGLTLDRFGNLYGTTVGGGATGWGSVFELSPSSNGFWSEQILYSFTGNDAGGDAPESEVVLDAAGNLYSTTINGGDLNCNTDFGYPYGCGLIFELTSGVNGWSESVLYTFTSVEPTSRLLIDHTGNLYGVGDGAIFELQPTTQGIWTFTALQSISFAAPNGDLALDGAEDLYGESQLGNTCNNSQCGSVFELVHSATGWSQVTLYAFQASGDGKFPEGGIALDANQNIFGVTFQSENQHDLGTVFELTPSSSGTWQESILFQFPQVDGDGPAGDLIADAAGNLYGVAAYGGTNANCPPTGLCGVVFRMSLGSTGQWQYNILYDFSQDAGGGQGPRGGLIFDSQGNLYGTTWSGGHFGYGTVYELSPDFSGVWHRKTLYSFGAVAHDGFDLFSRLVFDTAGNLYGTTGAGGQYGYGTVFELLPESDGRWRESVLYSFTGGSDGAQPIAGLLFDTVGNLYGTTIYGGGPLCGYGCGVVFELKPNGNGQWTETVLHTFARLDGGYPEVPLVFDSEGNLYGTTNIGGPGNGAGTVFELKPTGSGAWTESILHSFHGTSTDGSSPAAGVKFDSAGNLWGTTYWGGASTICSYSSGCGVLFELTPVTGGWNERIVHSFGVDGDGIEPISNVLIDASGNLFGMTWGGPGDNWGGTVFEITP